MRYILTRYTTSCMCDVYWPLNSKLKLSDIKKLAENRVRSTVDKNHTLEWKKFDRGIRLYYTRPLRETDHYFEEDYEDDDGWERLNAETYTSHEFTIWDTGKIK